MKAIKQANQNETKNTEAKIISISSSKNFTAKWNTGAKVISLTKSVNKRA